MYVFMQTKEPNYDIFENLRIFYNMNKCCSLHKYALIGSHFEFMQIKTLN